MSCDRQVPAVPAAQVGGDTYLDDAYLLDIREAHEWVVGHAPHSHRLPMMEVPVHLGELPTDSEPVVAADGGAGQIL